VCTQDKKMSAIKSVGIREFRANLYKYTRKNQEPIALTSHGETIGYYIPAQTRPQQKEIESLQKAVSQLSRLLTEKGISEDDIVADFQEFKNRAINEK
jgi:PHD/YefM family antitoxin component YafN of YafNO toxin-antitoxin module